MDESTGRWMLFGIGLMAILVVAFAIYRPLEPSSRQREQTTLTDELVSGGQQLFATNCVACHGQDATGGIGPALNSKQFLGSVSDDQIRSIISTGVPGSQMSAYLQDYGGPLTADQIYAIASYLRSLEPNAPDRPDWRDMLYGTTTTTAG
jgi:cytochrome c oxidase cbb3-type subunit 3